MNKRNSGNKKKFYMDDEQGFESKQAIALYNAEHSLTGGNKELANVGVKSVKEASLNIKCMNERQKLLKKSIESKDIIISVGQAGTGKTYIALATALKIMKTNPEYRKLVMIKSLNITSKQEAIGFIKGTVEEKLAPYMMSFTDNLEKILKSKETVAAMTEVGIFEYQPIAFVRGMTFTDSIVIVDEAQNLTFDVFKTIVTRLGDNCKMIFLGDKDQIDLPDKYKSCINTVIELFDGEDFVGVVNFLDADSVRSKHMPRILGILNKYEESKTNITKKVVKQPVISNT